MRYHPVCPCPVCMCPCPLGFAQCEQSTHVSLEPRVRPTIVLVVTTRTSIFQKQGGGELTYKDHPAPPPPSHWDLTTKHCNACRDVGDCHCQRSASVANLLCLLNRHSSAFGEDRGILLPKTLLVDSVSCLALVIQDDMWSTLLTSYTLSFRLSTPTSRHKCEEPLLSTQSPFLFSEWYHSLLSHSRCCGCCNCGFSLREPNTACGLAGSFRLRCLYTGKSECSKGGVVALCAPCAHPVRYFYDDFP